MKEFYQRRIIISRKMKQIQKNPDIYYRGLWSDLAKELGLRRQNLNTIKNRILKRTKVEVENNKRRKI